MNVDGAGAGGNSRAVSWIRAARRDFEKFPEKARWQILAALEIAAAGRKADIAKPLQGLGAGVFEVALKYRSDAWRTVYALKLDQDIWVVHAFQKKSTSGIKTPQREIETIRQRLKALREELSR